MSLIPSKNWRRIEEYVGDVLIDIFYLDKERNIYAFPTEMCRFAEYSSPRVKSSQTLDKIMEDIIHGIGATKIVTPSGDQEANFLMNEDVHFFIMNLGTKEKVRLLKKGYALIVEKYRKGMSIANYQDRRLDHQIEVLDKLILAQTQTFQEFKTVKTEVKTVKTEVTKIGKRVDKIEEVILTNAERENKINEISQLANELSQLLFKFGFYKKYGVGTHKTVYAVIWRKYRCRKVRKMADFYLPECVKFLQFQIELTKKYKEIPEKFKPENLRSIQPEDLPSKQSKLSFREKGVIV